MVRSRLPVPSTFLWIVPFCSAPRCRSNLDRRRVQQVQGTASFYRQCQEEQTSREEMQREAVLSLLHRDSASLLPFQGYSCVAFRTGTFQPSRGLSSYLLLFSAGKTLFHFFDGSSSLSFMGFALKCIIRIARSTRFAKDSHRA